jgi:hypothetical protein
MLVTAALPRSILASRAERAIVGKVAEQDQSRRIVIAQQFLQSRPAASHSLTGKRFPAAVD